MDYKMKLKLTEAAEHFEFNRSYFYVMRNGAPDKFNYILALNKTNFINAFNLYRDEMENIKLELQTMYFYLGDIRKLSHFARYCVGKGDFNYPQSLVKQYQIVFFSTLIGFKTHNTYLRYKGLLPLFEQYKKDNNLKG